MLSRRPVSVHERDVAVVEDGRDGVVELALRDVRNNVVAGELEVGTAEQLRHSAHTPARPLGG